jgi:AcrR family transcriptional regulator
VADAALVSRTTAYRYFPSQRALLVAAFPKLDTQSLLGDDPPANVVARVERFAEAMTDAVLENEQEMRSMLRLSLDPGVGDVHDIVLREGRRTRWAEDALAPLRGHPDYERLVYALAAAVGIEAFVWLVDVGGLSRERAVETMRWSARALVYSVDR